MTAVATTILSKKAAERLTKAVVDHMTVAGEQLTNLRETLLELYEGRGWEALGYESWRAYCLDRFQQKQAWFYQQVQAARMERILALEPGTLPTTTARALAPVAREPEVARAVYAAAVRQSAPAAPSPPQVAQVVRSFSPVPKGSQGVKGRGAVGKFAGMQRQHDAQPDTEAAIVQCPHCGTQFPLPALET
jgi:hypothetical protein